MTDLTVAAIKDLLVPRLAELLVQLAPGMRRHGGYWQGPNPTRAKDGKTSFTVWHNGAWKEFDSGEKGDIIDLIAYCRQGTRGQAIAFAKDFLGLRNMPEAERRRLDEQARARAERHRKAEDDERQAKQRRAFEMWLAGRPVTAESVTGRYLAGRGIALAELVNAEGDLKDSAGSLKYWGPRGEGDRPWLGPAMLAPIRQLSGEILGVHATFLKPDGTGKAPVLNAKLMLGLKQGGFVRLSRGVSGLPFGDLAKAGLAEPLVVGEGIETCLSVALAVPEARVWAALDLGNMATLTPHPGIGPLVILKENDTKPAAIDQRQRVMDQLAAKGFDIREMVPPAGNDFNDTLKEE